MKIEILSGLPTIEELMINERMFLNIFDCERDKEIKRIKSSKEWISLSEHFFDKGEF